MIAAAPTAFREDGAVDLEFIPPMASRLSADGVAGVFVNGTTGEGLSLSVEERKAEAWRAALPAGMKLFVHVAALALPEAQRLARHAEAIGADATAALAPGFFKPSGVEALSEWCAAVAGAAPSLPFYFYHMPSMNGVHLRVLDFLRAAEPRIPNLAGVKFTSEALDDFQVCMAEDGGRFEMLWGRDEMLLAAYAAGATAAVGSTYNVAAPLYRELLQAFQAGDLVRARGLQEQSVRMILDFAGTGNFFAALKHRLGAQGLPISPRVRPPLSAVSRERLAALGQS